MSPQQTRAAWTDEPLFDDVPLRPDANLLDGLLVEAGSRFAIRNLTLPDRELQGGADAILFVGGADGARGETWETPSGHHLKPRRRNQVGVRLSDDHLARVGARLERGEPDAMLTSDLEPGQRWVVNFGNPNATKALHVGHLRQLAIGHALSSMHEAAGADVVRQTRVGDCGRSMGEALAGYREFGDVALGSGVVKGDRYIGDCYARYVRRLAHDVDRVGSEADEALAREGEHRRDEAERLLAGWLAGEDVEREFAAMRSWVLAGHEETMRRLGIGMQRTLLESDYLSQGGELQRRAMELGLVHRAESGATLYETGEEGYPYLLLCRPDGFPTQHLRYMATWHAIRDLCEGTRTIGVLGAEWGPMARFTNALLAVVHGEPAVHPYVRVIHGMVVAGANVVKSSHGDESRLVDEVLDRVVASDRVRDLCRAHDRVNPEDVARMLALAYFLNTPLSEDTSLTVEELLSPRTSIGWVLAEAWVHAADPRFDGNADPDPEDLAYRTLTVHSQKHRQLLQRCLAQSEILPLARFHLHLAQWYLRQPASPRLGRAMRFVLGSGSAAMGIGLA